jgi:hypothetical protein
LVGEADDAPWIDAYSESFSDPEDADRSIWVPPAAPAGAACELCGEPLLHVVYGFPGGELIELAERGLVILGGCMPGGPRFRCPNGHASNDDDGDAHQARGDGGASRLRGSDELMRHTSIEGWRTHRAVRIR